MMPNGPPEDAPAPPRIVVAIELADGGWHQAVCRTAGCTWAAVPTAWPDGARLDQDAHRDTHRAHHADE